MALIDLISRDVIKVPLTGTNKVEVMRELVEVLHDAGKIEKTEEVMDGLLERESKGTTGLESGIAVPHCKTDAVDTLTLAIGIAPQGVDFESIDGEPSKLFFLMLAPPDQSGPHIEALAEIARLTQSSSFCDALIDSKDAGEVLELFQD